VLLASLHMLHRAGDWSGPLLFVGAGLIGQLAIQLARPRAALILASDRSAFRLRTALASGADATHDATATKTPLASWIRTHCEDGIAAAFLSFEGDATNALRESVEALHAAPDGTPRGTIVCVGRLHAQMALTVEMGNVDVRVSARCGLGYRDDEWAHGRRSYAAPPGEDTVEQNLRECLDRIASGVLRPEIIHTHRYPIEEAARAYPLLDDLEAALGVTLLYGSD